MITTLQSQFLAALALSLFGGLHCAAMCGGFVAAIHTAPAHRSAKREGGLLAITLAWNLGRITGYTCAGLLAGLLGGALFAQDLLPVQIALLIAGSIVLAGVGISLLGASAWQRLLEPLGAGVWRRIGPIAARWMPPRTAKAAMLAGFFWGWIPCGMVYAALPIALVSGGALQGGAVLLAFGIGTLPNLLVLHAGAARLARGAPAGHSVPAWLRTGAGVVILAFAASGLAHAMGLAGVHSPALLALASVCHSAGP